jgi:hypothetical protein
MKKKKKVNDLLTIVWVSIHVGPKLPSRVRRLGQKALPCRHFEKQRPLDFGQILGFLQSNCWKSTAFRPSTVVQSPTLGAHTHAHAHAHPCPWVLGGYGCDIIVYGWAWVGIGFVHPCIQLQIGVELLGCREYANEEAVRAKASDSERPSICPIQPRLRAGLHYGGEGLRS